MQTRTLDNTETLTQQYANQNECRVFVYDIKNGMHQHVHYEWYPEGDPNLRFFDRDPDFIVEPETVCPKCGGTVGHRINCPDGIAFSNDLT